MSHCRIFLNQPLEPGYDIEIPADQTHYLRHVMRLLSGDPITIFNGLGGEYKATIVGLTKQAGTCHVETFIDVERELPVRIHIIQCANKSDKIETVLQKCTELGAASFQIANSERSQFKLTDKKLASRLDRWQKIIIEAAEQSERTIIPSVVWAPSLKNIQATGNNYTLHPESVMEWHKVKERISTATDITLAIGPEGGWSRKDLETLSELGFQNLSFGSRVLRTETAAPALTAAIQAL
ncbi:MAG: 16S rRNA (uracil(1498)-N(3))-methyltransferase [Mariprofundaceae bacterium]